jgi:hypothetical protein
MPLPAVARLVLVWTHNDVGGSSGLVKLPAALRIGGRHDWAAWSVRASQRMILLRANAGLLRKLG